MGLTLLIPRRRPTRRRGVASLLAMLYLVLFAALALGFYAQTNMSSQVSNNERRLGEARVAAESGIAFMRYQMSQVTIPAVWPALTDDQVFSETQMDLVGILGSYDLGGDTVGDIVYPTGKPAYFEIPSDPSHYIALTSNGPYFRVRVTQRGRNVAVTAVGKASNTVTTSAGGRSGVEVVFKTEEWPTSFFGYGMASKGPVKVDVAKLMVQGSPATQASILSTYQGASPVTIGNINSTAAAPTGISGNITVIAPYTPSYTGTYLSVGGQTTVANINATQVKSISASDAPEFPAADTSVFTKYATTQWVSGKTLYENIYIPANSNPTFDSTMTVRGVVYVRSPNKVSFQGGVVLQAVIVGEQTSTIDLANNLISFSGNGVAKDPLSALPPDPKWDELRKLTGTFILAPTFDVSFTGNFSSVAGSVYANRLTVSGNSSGSFAGSLVGMNKNYPLTITGSSAVTLGAPTGSGHPGVRFKERYVPDKGSYLEVSPDLK